MNRAWTILETLSVLLITVVLAAVSYPVFAGVKREAKIRSSGAKLQQVYMATMIYREEHDGGGFGTLEQMGLPSAYFVVTNRFGLSEESMNSSCGAHWSVQPAPGADVHNFVYFPGDGSSPFPDLAVSWQDRLVLYFDQHCNSSEVDVRNRFHEKLGVGVLMGGNLVRRRGRGDLFKPEFWSAKVD